VREIYPALSLGDHLSFDVSEYMGLHHDIFEMPDGRAFINSNPGASILGAIPYALARPAIDYIVEHVQKKRALSENPIPEYKTDYPLVQEFYRKATERGLDVKFGLAAGVTQSFLMAPLSAFSVVVMFYVLISLKISSRASLLLALLYAFSTPVLYRTAHLNHNLIISHFAFFAFVLLWRPWDDPARPRKPLYLAAGLLAGYTVVLDYSGVVIVLGLFIYMIIRRKSLPQQLQCRSDFFYFMLGIGLSGAVLMGYQWHSFGNPIFPAQHYMLPATYTGHGYQGMDWPRFDLLWETSFGIRYGLFTSAPILILAFYFPAWLSGSTRVLKGREIAGVAIIAIGFFIFCSANQYGRMQFNSGVRHIVPVVPFLFLVVSGVIVRMPKTLAVIVSVFALYWSWCLSMYRDVEFGLGIFDAVKIVTTEGIRFPWLVTLEKMGYIPAGKMAVPLLLLTGILICLIWVIKRPKIKSGQPGMQPNNNC
jgi:hypothetical protein